MEELRCNICVPKDIWNLIVIVSYYIELQLSETSLHLLIDYFPSSITRPDKRGILPFHHVALNTALSVEVLMLFISLASEAISPI